MRKLKVKSVTRTTKQGKNKRIKRLKMQGHKVKSITSVKSKTGTKYVIKYI